MAYKVISGTLFVGLFAAWTGLGLRAAADVTNQLRIAKQAKPIIDSLSSENAALKERDAFTKKAAKKIALLNEKDKAAAVITLYYEANGEPIEGQKKVLNVMMNRVRKGFDATVADVVLDKSQFSAWLPSVHANREQRANIARIYGILNGKNIQAIIAEAKKPMYRKQWEILDEVYRADPVRGYYVVDVSEDSLYYYNKEQSSASGKAWFASLNCPERLKTGNHYFCKQKPSSVASK
jgi:spore germination cell wall hydrolase CwlJ-like protein